MYCPKTVMVLSMACSSGDKQSTREVRVLALHVAVTRKYLHPSGAASISVSRGHCSFN